MTADQPHTQLLADLLLATEPFRPGTKIPARAANFAQAALRAVVERHKPIPCGWPTCKTPDTHRLCAACGSAVNHPCPELELIADQLGLTDEGAPRD